MLARMPRRSGVGTGSRGGLGSLVLACIAGLLLIWLAPSPNAAADDSVLPVIPSTAQVDAAKSAVATQGDRVAELDAAYQQATAEAGARQHAVATAAAAYAAAQAAEDAAAHAAELAAAEADRAAQASAAARDAISRTAAAAYEQNGSTGELMLGLLTMEGPQRAVDLAQYLEDSANSLDRQLRDAAMLAGVADSATAVAAERSRVLTEARLARAAALTGMEAELASATDALNAVAGRQRAMVAELAALQQTSEETQQQRLDGRAAAAAAQAAADAAAQRAAREAAERAAAQAKPSPTPASRATPSTSNTPSTTTSTTSPPRPSASSSSSSSSTPKATSTTTTSTTTPSASASPTSTPPPTSSTLAWAQAHPKTVAQQIMPTFGFDSSQWTCLESLWQRESGWNWAADNPYSSAYGIPQALPGTKMATAGADWLVSPATQITWGLGYIKSRYGTPCGAWSAWQSRSPHWY